MPVVSVEEQKQGIFANPQYSSPTVEDQKRGLFANPSYTTSGLGNNPTGAGSTDPSQTRLNAAGLNTGGTTNNPNSGVKQQAIQFSSGTGTQDWRVRVSVAPGSGVLYDMPNPGILDPIKKTNGVIFPYAPNLTVSHNARYNSQPLTHSNYNNYFYEGSEVQSIQIAADFTVQNLAEAAYFLGALYFFRAATKMFYGDSGLYQGAPPPIVYLDGYGSHYLPHVSCVVTGFSHTMPPDVDYLEVNLNISSASGGGQLQQAPTSGGSGSVPTQSTGSGLYATRVPLSSQFTVTLQPVYSRNLQRQFNYEAFARGELLTGQGKGAGYL